MENRMYRGIKVREHGMLLEFSELGVTRVGVCVGEGRAAAGGSGSCYLTEALDFLKPLE